MKIKSALEEYSGLLISIGAIVGMISTAAIFVASLVLNEMIDERIAEKVGTTASVTAIQNTLVVLSDDVDDLERSVEDLDDSIQGLNDDVKDTLRILATE
jgi:peptidoglycan hydrolase CwlO-like protein